jgi:uncharacterized protein YbjT (DUF2867 family)
MSIGRSVLLAGATGLVGRECLRQLIADPGVERLVVLTRRALPAAIVPERGASKLEAYEIDFAKLDRHVSLLEVDQIFCALGTTLKQAGSRERFREIDFGIPLALALLGLQQGVKHFLLVSSTGASAKARAFYSRVKGVLEDAVRALAYRSITIVRPSLLLGAREEFRMLEHVSKWSSIFWPRKYKPVAASKVAGALVRAAERDAQGVRIIESEAL